MSQTDQPYSRKATPNDLFVGLLHLLATQHGGRVEIDTSEMRNTALLAHAELIVRDGRVLLIVQTKQQSIPTPENN